MAGMRLDANVVVAVPVDTARPLGAFALRWSGNSKPATVGFPDTPFQMQALPGFGLYGDCW